MRALRILLALLTVLGSTVANAAPGAKLVNKDFSFDLAAGDQAVICTTDLSKCSPPKVFTPPTGINCGTWNFAAMPAGSTGAMACYKWVADVVTPPVTPPVVDAGPLPVNLGQNFTTTANTWVKLCDATQQNCSRQKLVAISNSGSYFYCKVEAFQNVPANAASCVVSEPPPPVAASYCWSLNPLVYEVDDFPATASSYYEHTASLLCENGKVDVVPYNKAERDAAWEHFTHNVPSREAANAYAKTRPVHANTPSEAAHIETIRAKYTAAAVPPVTPPVVAPPIYIVAKNGTTLTRPSYLVTNGVKATKQNGTVLVGAPCSCTTLQLGTSCSVAGQPDQSKAAKPALPASTVSVCAVEK